MNDPATVVFLTALVQLVTAGTALATALVLLGAAASFKQKL